jgi:hypothetical protein
MDDAASDAEASRPGRDTMRALASNLPYLDAWAMAAGRCRGASERQALRFVEHHWWDPARRKADPQHGVPVEVAARLHVAFPSP